MNKIYQLNDIKTIKSNRLILKEHYNRDDTEYMQRIVIELENDIKITLFLFTFHYLSHKYFIKYLKREDLYIIHRYKLNIINKL